MTEAKIALRKAIKQLYDTFEKYPKPDPADREFPLTEEDLEIHQQSQIFDMPLRLIDRDILLTFGTSEDFRYYLPRIFEFFLEPKGWWIWLWLSRLPLADWFYWDKNEQDSVKNYLMALWQYVLTDYQQLSRKQPRQHTVVYDCLHGFLECCVDITPFIDAWEQNNSNQATRNLMWILDAAWSRSFNLFDANMGYIDQHYPKVYQDNKNIIYQWLASSFIEKRLKSLTPIAEKDSNFQYSLENALDAYLYLKLENTQ